MPSTTVNGVAIHYVDRGSGLPVALVHGFPLDLRMWDAQLPDLTAAGHRAVAVDCRGFGQSARTGPFTIEQLADDLRGVLAAAGALPCVLGGLSMGGYVALAVARKYPADLKGLMLFDTQAGADSPQAREGRQKNIDLVRSKGPAAIADAMIPKLLAPGAADRRPELAASLRKMIEACPADTIAQALVALRDRPDSTAALPTIKVPTLVVVGDGDQITPVEVAEKMRAGIGAAAELAVIRGAGHMSPMEQPAQVNQVVRGFLKRIG
ncbi:MAG TPA: alpha/beta fold hydrolase [Humisphaera sp.]